MSSNNRLKVCTFNAKCDELDYKCCIKDSCRDNKCGRASRVPDSLVAAMIAVTILPSKADIYNIQNVRNKCVVEHLLKEIVRVKDVTDKLKSCAKLDKPVVLEAACQLNSFSGLCHDGAELREALCECKICNLDYVNALVNCVNAVEDCEAYKSLVNDVLKYKNVSEYEAYYSGTCLTLVKKSLKLCPETREVPSVDALVLFFEHHEKKLINVNVNLGDLENTIEGLGCKRGKVESLLCFLRKYKDCGSVLMSGAFGDLDYDVQQLLYAGDAFVPEVAQKLLANGINESPVPSDFPCDLSNPLYELMEFLIKTCNAELVPYSWLLQYLRLKGCKKSCLYKLVECKTKCNKTKQVASSSHNAVNGGNRSQLRNKLRKSDKGQSHCSAKKEDKCDKPACVPSGKCCENSKKECKDVNKCKVSNDKCGCDESRCEVKCRDNECKCKKTKHHVKVDLCKDLCAKKGKSCCDSCKKGKGCEGNKVCPTEECKYCDTLTTLKESLGLYNTLDKVEDVNNKYTGFYDHFNRCNDCKYPRGMFQAWAMCEDYEKPHKASRVVDNNSELLALQHFLVSDCLKNNITCVSLSDLCIEKCGVPVKTLIADKKFNALNKTPVSSFAPTGVDGYTKLEDAYVFDYSGAVVRSFFTNRVYCVSFDFPHSNKGCEVECGETLHGLGLTSLWSAICKYGSDTVGIETFERFGLDKHPYFKNLFWKSCERRVCTDFTCNLESIIVSPLLERYTDCEKDSLLYIQKKDSLTEEEFYKHLLCVYSNSDSRDRFIITIAYMESLYRTCKNKSGCSENRELLCDKDVIANMFKYLSKCFCDENKVAKFLNSQSVLKFPGNGFVPIITAKPTTLYQYELLCVAKLIGLLSKGLNSNCLVLEVLARQAAKALTLGDNATCGCGDTVELLASVAVGDCEALDNAVNSLICLLPEDCKKKAVKNAFRSLLCGADPVDVVREIVSACCDNDVVNLLFLLINGNAPVSPVVV